jgi:hypothetical protein
LTRTSVFFENVNFVGYYAKTDTPGAHGNDASYRGRFDYGADRFGVQLEHIAIGNQFNPRWATSDVVTSAAPTRTSA